MPATLMHHHRLALDPLPPGLCRASAASCSSARAARTLSLTPWPCAATSVGGGPLGWVVLVFLFPLCLLALQSMAMAMGWAVFLFPLRVLEALSTAALMVGLPTRPDFHPPDNPTRPSICRPPAGPALAAVFADPGVVKVLHGADSDVVWLQRDYGLFLCNMFDTGQVCAAVFGWQLVW